tara:strand:- start:533 stop:2917 length:2385 start_codon:yes stop_codon:yes gene_type:complete
MALSQQEQSDLKELSEWIVKHKESGKSLDDPDFIQVEKAFNQLYDKSLVSTQPPALPEQALHLGEGMQRLKDATQTGANYLGQAYQATKNFFTGDDVTEFEDAPELPAFMTPKGVSSARMALARNDIGKLDILQESTGENFAGNYDAFGNIYVDITPQQAERYGIEPRRYYINKAGVSGQDFEDLATTGAIEAATMAPLMRFGGKIAGPLGSMVMAGVGAGGGSVVQDNLAAGAGSKQGIDIQNALLSGAFGIGGDLAGRLLAPVFRRLFKSNNITPDGRLSQNAKETLNRMGVDTDAITPEWSRRFAEAQKVVDTPEGSVFADAETLPVPVKLTRGDLSRNIEDMRVEENARRGNLGPEASEIMNTARTRQNEQILANQQAIINQVGTGAELPANQGIANVGNILEEQATALKAKGSAAYKVASEAGANLKSSGVKNFLNTAKQTLKKEFPSSSRRTDANAEIDDFLADLPQMDFITNKAGQTTDNFIEANRLEAFRQDLLAKQRALPKGSDQAPIFSSLINQLDDFAEGAFDAGLVTGDRAALEKFKQARGLWRELRTKYEGKEAGKIYDIIQAVRNGDANANVANIIFDAQSIGMKKGALQAVKKMKEILGEDSPAFKNLKEDTALRLFNSNTKGNQLGKNMETIFSGDKFATSFNAAMKDAPELMKEVFTKEELALINQFKRVAQRATNRRKEIVSPGSGDAPLQFMREFLSRAGGPIGRLTQGIASKTIGGLTRASDINSLNRGIDYPLAVTPEPSVLPPISAVTAASSQRPENTEAIRKSQLMRGLSR